jgi:rod shape-determining protein MreC
MESFFSRYRNALVLITVLVAQVIGLAVQVRRPEPNAADKGSVRLIRSWVVNSVTPPEMFFHWIGKSIRGVWTNYLDLIHVRRQNKDLKSELDRLRLEQDSLAEDARQGQRLQALLGFKEKYIYQTVAAQVIGTSGTEQSHVLLIDKGSEDGIKPDLPVITPDGIVGKTRDVFRHTSQVLEISDVTSGAGVILEKTRIRGVLRGDSWGQPEMVNVSPDERIQKGEAVLTSGGDAIYPRGLSVGTVDRVTPQPEGTLVNVLVKPAANLGRLEEVLVITTTGNQMPAEMEQDLSDAQQKASDVLAERLPSRADPNLPADQQQDKPPAGADADVLPPMRPPQALHPDHYTPSDTPPAAELVPGQKIANAASTAPAGQESTPPPAPKPSATTPAGAASGNPASSAPATRTAAPKTTGSAPGSTATTPKAAGAAPKPKAKPAANPASQQAPQDTPPKTNPEPPATTPQNPSPQRGV